MSHYLTELPTELVENIAYNLPLSDVRNLRLTCRSLKDQIAHPFKDRFFRTKSISLTADSLKSLIDVGRHPQLGPHLRNLVINATPELEKEYIYRQHQLHSAHFDESTREQLLRELKLINKRKETLSRFVQAGEDRKLLILAFLIIRRLRSIAFSYDGLNIAEPDDSMYYLIHLQAEMSRPFVSTMAAIAFTGLTVEELTVEDQRQRGFVSIARLKFSSMQYSQLRTAFAHLHVLKLDLRDWMTPRAGLTPTVPNAPFVARFLSRVTSLRELDLSCHVYSSREEDVFADIATMVRLPHLVKCTLGLILAKEQNLLRFLRAPKASLKHLTLRNSVLVTGNWTSFLESLVDTVDLDVLSLDNLYEMESVALLGEEGKLAVVLTEPGLREKTLNHARGYRLTSPVPYFQYFWDDAVRT